MALTIRTQVNMKLTDPISSIVMNQQKISSDSEGTSVFTGTATGGSATTLVDTATNFLLEGIKVGTVVTRTLGGTSVVTSISTTTNPNDTLNFSALSGGASFAVGNTYSLSTTLNMNFTTETYELPAAGTSWVKISKGDIGKIRDIFLILLSDYQYGNIDILITNEVDPNTPIPIAKTFVIRDMFVTTSELDDDVNIWAKNPSNAVAILLAIIGGENS